MLGWATFLMVTTRRTCSKPEPVSTRPVPKHNQSLPGVFQHVISCLMPMMWSTSSCLTSERKSTRTANPPLKRETPEKNPCDFKSQFFKLERKNRNKNYIQKMNFMNFDSRKTWKPCDFESHLMNQQYLFYFVLFKRTKTKLYSSEIFHNRNWQVLQNQIPAQLCNLQWLPFQTIVALSNITLGRLGPLVIQQFAKVQRKRDQPWDPCKILRFPKPGKPIARYPTFLKYIFGSKNQTL